MELLITGGTVFASRFTAEYFAAKGHSVYVLNRGSRPQPDGVIPIIADRHALGDSLLSFNFDAVIDVTAYNAEDVNSLMDGLSSFGTYILISSSAVYPEYSPQPFSESVETGPNAIWGNYGTDKIEAEKAALSMAKNTYILRPPYLCGPMNNLYREAFVFECAEQGRPFYIPGEGEMKLQFCHIGDMCRVIEAILLQKPEQHIFNIGDPATVSIKEWTELCYEAVGKRPRFISVDGSVPQRSYFPFYDYEYALDVTEMERLIDSVTPLRESIKSSYDYFRERRDQIVRKPLIDFIDKELKGKFL